MTATAILDQEILPLRAKLIEIAATLDRLDRAGGIADDDRRLQNVHAAIGTLLTCERDRAEEIQRLFSRPYDAAWATKYGVAR